ncbi:Agmatine coumaroyltransferase-1 [Dendrobium catenatum]|uniref:Agmatine coumaroyltransferase-1 n=1 Tax=Dendrobium catenatum TaxID=906689 RepID=A0A2I0WVC3_9ASPA|nr:Agmatine coumaroyltransferase-1 [Dendrobium catenatum]
MGTFFVAWSKITRGIPLDPIPNYDLSWLKQRFPPKFEFEHWGAEFIPPKHYNNDILLNQSFVEPHSTSNILIHYSYEFINSKLKAGVKENFTTFEVLLGHIWRKITIARALGQGEATMIRVSVNGRPRLRPPVSNEFVGNLVLDAYPMSKAGELINGGVEEAAAIIREAVRRIDNRYFQSFIDFGEMNKEENLVPIYDLCGNFLLPNLEVDSWLGLQFEDRFWRRRSPVCFFAYLADYGWIGHISSEIM